MSTKKTARVLTRRKICDIIIMRKSVALCLAGVAEQADATDLKSVDTKVSYRFDPGHRHQRGHRRDAREREPSRAARGTRGGKRNISRSGADGSSLGRRVKKRRGRVFTKPKPPKQGVCRAEWRRQTTMRRWRAVFALAVRAIAQNFNIAEWSRW